MRGLSLNDSGGRCLRIQIVIDRVNDGQLAGGGIGSNRVRAIRTFQPIQDRFPDTQDRDRGIGIMGPAVV